MHLHAPRRFPLPHTSAQCGCHWDGARSQWISNSTGQPWSPPQAQEGESSSGVCILSIARGRDYQESLGEALIQNKRAFCAACGYRCLLVNRTFETDRHPSWDKILAVQHALSTGSCNLTMWVDADVVFLRSFALAPLIRTAIAGTREYGGLNGGVLFFRRSEAMEMLLRLAWKEDRFKKPPGLEQSALRYVLGKRPGLRQQVTMYDNLVRWVPQFYVHPVVRRNRTLRETSPLFHAAGCSLFVNDRGKKAMCMQQFRSHLRAADLPRGACSQLDEELVRPRHLSSGDINIPRGQGRELIEPRTKRKEKIRKSAEATPPAIRDIVLRFSKAVMREKHTDTDALLKWSAQWFAARSKGHANGKALGYPKS